MPDDLPQELHAFLEARGHRRWEVLGRHPSGDGWILEIQDDTGTHLKGVLRGGDGRPPSLRLASSHRTFP